LKAGIPQQIVLKGHFGRRACFNQREVKVKVKNLKLGDRPGLTPSGGRPGLLLKKAGGGARVLRIGCLLFAVLGFILTVCSPDLSYGRDGRDDYYYYGYGRPYYQPDPYPYGYYYHPYGYNPGVDLLLRGLDKALRGDYRPYQYRGPYPGYQFPGRGPYPGFIPPGQFKKRFRDHPR
jgi:hypothetical protein